MSERAKKLKCFFGLKEMITKPNTQLKHHSSLTYDQTSLTSHLQKKQLISYLRKTKKNKMPRFTIISAQEMKRLIPMGQKLTGLTAKKMNQMDILELMGYLPKELLLQILLGDDWWKPTHVPTELKIGGFKWDLEKGFKWKAPTDRNIRASIQIAMPFRDFQTPPQSRYAWKGDEANRDLGRKWELAEWEKEKKKFSEVPTKFTEKRVIMSGDGKAVGYKTAGMMLMGIPKKDHFGTKEKFRQGEYGFTFEKMRARGYTKERWEFISNEEGWRHWLKHHKGKFYAGKHETKEEWLTAMRRSEAQRRRGM